MKVLYCCGQYYTIFIRRPPVRRGVKSRDRLNLACLSADKPIAVAKADRIINLMVVVDLLIAHHLSSLLQSAAQGRSRRTASSVQSSSVPCPRARRGLSKASLKANCGSIRSESSAAHRKELFRALRARQTLHYLDHNCTKRISAENTKLAVIEVPRRRIPA